MYRTREGGESCIKMQATSRGALALLLAVVQVHRYIRVFRATARLKAISWRVPHMGPSGSRLH